MMSRMMLLTTLMLASLTLSTATLTKDNLSDVAGDKMVFLLLYAPWCGHCRAVKPAWEALTQDYQDSDTLYVGECDCTADCKDLCQHVGVQGYPTIKYGHASALEDYKGGRDLDSLKKHAESIKPSCTTKRRDMCSTQEIEQLDDLMSKSKTELSQMIADQEAIIATLEEEFKTSVEALQKTYTDLLSVKTEKTAQVQASGLNMMRVVLAELAT